MRKLVGVVLAGGRGRRMGRGKGGLRVGDQTLAQRAAAAVGPHVSRVFVSVAPGLAGPAPGIPTVEDRPPTGRGPLAGIDAAFRATSDADLLVLACDYPLVDASLLGRIVETARTGDELVMPVDGGGHDHPLVALWRRPCAARVAAALDEGRLAVRDVVASCRVRRLDRVALGIDSERVLLNVNRPSDLASLARTVHE